MHSQGRIVTEVTDEVMDGDTPLEKKLNAYLTKRFILSRDVPADECIREAKKVLNMALEGKVEEEDLAKYFHETFGFEDDDHAPFVAAGKEVMEIIKAPK